MKKRAPLFFFFSVGLILLFSQKALHAQAQSTFSPSSQVHIQADTIEYLKDQGIVMARGEVDIQQGSDHLYADMVRYDMNSQEVQANGHVVFQNDTETVETDSLTYNLKTKTGKAFNIKTTAPPWIILGDEVDIEPKKIVIKNARATTCDYPKAYEHYHMQTDTITIYSGDYLVAQNVVFYIGKVPVFYFPFFVKSIHDVRTPFAIQSGSTSYLGNYVLLTNNYFFSPVNYGALYTDYFSQKGIGIGIRNELSLNNYSAFSLYFYGIQEKDTQQFRWESRLRGLWAVSSDFQGRVEADMPGDGLFSEDYSVARRDPTLVSTFREYDISTTLTRQNYTLGVLLDRQLLADPNDPTESHFIDSQIELPEVDFDLLPQPFINRNFLTYNFIGSYKYAYTQANGYYVHYLTSQLSLSKTKVLFNTQSLYTQLSLNEDYQNLSDVGVTVGTGSAGDTGSVAANSTWSGRWSEFMTSNVTYNFTKLLNNLTPFDPADGITSNFLSSTLTFTVGSVLRATTGTSYDFTLEKSPVGARFNYLNQQFYFTPSTQFDYLVTMDYSVQANALKDFNSVLDYTSPQDMWRFRLSGNFVDPNVGTSGYISEGQQQTLEVAGEIDFSLFTNYRISALETYDCVNAQFLSRSISLYRDLHDWEAQIDYSDDPVNGQQISFTLNLKAMPGRPLSVSDQQLQNLNGIRNQGLTGSATQFQ